MAAILHHHCAYHLNLQGGACEPNKTDIMHMFSNIIHISKHLALSTTIISEIEQQ
jgi:hypothetical protein